MALLSLFLVPLSTDPTMKSTPRLLRQQGPVRSANTSTSWPLPQRPQIVCRAAAPSTALAHRWPHYFMTARPTPLESSTSRATSPTLSSTSPPLPAPGAPDNPLIQGALDQMMSIFEKRIQERDAEFEDHWAKMLEATAERDSAKMDLMTERALWNEEKKVLQQQISQLEVQLKEREAAIEGARGIVALFGCTDGEHLFWYDMTQGQRPEQSARDLRAWSQAQVLACRNRLELRP